MRRPLDWLRALSSRQWTVVALVCLTLTSLAWVSSWRSATLSLSARVPHYRSCDPFAEPGFLEPNLAAPLQTDWRALKPGCPAPPRWIEALAHLVKPVEGSHEDLIIAEHLHWLRDQTVLVIGDSVDRNAVDTFGQLIGIQAVQTDYASPESPVNILADHHAPRLLHIPQLNFRFATSFHYGMQDLNWFSEDNFRWPKGGHPGAPFFEDRVDQLYVPFASRMSVPPTLIVFQSSLWDLRFIYDIEGELGLTRTLVDPLQADNVTWYDARLTHAIAHLKRSFPGTTIIMRGIFEAPGTGSEWHSDLRVNQLRQVQRAVTAKMGIYYLDFGNVFSGFGHYVDDVHLSAPPAPGSIALIWSILHHVKRMRSDSWRKPWG